MELCKAGQNMSCGWPQPLPEGTFSDNSMSKDLDENANERFQFFYDMMTSSNGNIFHVTDPLCGEFTGDRWIPRTKPAGDLRRHRADYDVTVMK